MNKKRIYYSKDLKRRALIQYANGEKLDTFLRSNNIDIDSLIKRDKKYISKLLYKWRNELYKNNEILFLTNDELSTCTLEQELLSLSDDEPDVIMINIKDKIIKGKNKYKKLKNRIFSSYQKKI